MDFEYSADQQAILDAVASLLEQQAGPARAIALHDKDGYDTELDTALREAGFTEVARGDDTGPLEAALIAEAVARAADSSLAPSAFPQPLPAGVELRILEERAPWLRVRLANGRDAWLNRSSVTRIVPPESETS